MNIRGFAYQVKLNKIYEVIEKESKELVLHTMLKGLPTCKSGIQ
jgi:hypothetical protein